MNHVPPSPLRLGLDLATNTLRFIVPIWVLVLAVIATITAIVNALGTVSTSIVDFAGMPARYWFMTAGIILVARCFGPYIAQGVTRRAFAIAVATAGLMTSVVIGLIMSGGYIVESFVYDAFGWEQALDTKHLFDSGGQIGAVVTEMLLVYTGHFIVGWALGVMFFRYSWLPAIASSLAVYMFIAGAEFAIGAGWSGSVARSILDQGVNPAVGVPVAVVLIAVTGSIAWRATLTAPVPCRSH